MRKASPQMRSLAKRLIAYETNGNNPMPARTPETVCQRLRVHLATVMGVGGVRALFVRALALANAEVPWLSTLHVRADGSLESSQEPHPQVTPEEGFEGGVVLLAHLLGLLVAFIGEILTLSLVREVWPQVPATVRELGQGGKR